ncbi:FAST kinase domain-containing 2, mitochondrial isoform X1 [Pelobates cultripes]|uniref:FAST kinase domain-containing 2, mitochondrial isoform X1 n=1 Tax=Pelobates cultripes TaxID=61616 RepID=A0AAD1SN67_PELCU|nr:FAST kinase domain-containing 2, mitochondrial isoform X1 [Pelobates cultripes]
MSEKAYLCALRMMRHLKSCNSSVGLQLLQPTRNYTSRASVLGRKLLMKTQPFPSTYKQSATSVRFLSNVTPVSKGENDIKSVEGESLVDGTPNLFEEKLDSNYLNPLEDVITEEQWTPAKTRKTNNFAMAEEFQKCNSPSDVLDLCSSSSLSLKHISNSFTTMWITVKKIKQKQGQRQYEKQIMFEHQNFENLCRQAMLAAHRMGPGDLVYTLHAVVKLQVPQTTRLVQTLLRVCQERLNELEEREISIVASALDGMERCGNVDSLRAGLRVLVELRLPEIKRIMPLQTMMNCIGKDAPLSLKKKLENKALEMRGQFTLPNAQHMFASLAAINLTSLPLLNFCKRNIIDNIDVIPFWKMVKILNACIQLSYRDEELLTAIGDYILDTIYLWETKQVSIFLMQMAKLGFRHVSLLDSFAEKVIENPESLTLKDLVCIAKVYSLLNHLPEGQSQPLLAALNTSLHLYLPRISSPELLKVLFSLCNLGFFPSVPLEKLMREDVLNELLDLANPHIEDNTRMLHSIKMCLQLDENSPEMPGLLDLMTVPVDNSRPQIDVETTLEAIVDDPADLQKGIQLFSNYYIGFIVVYNNRPVLVVPKKIDFLLAQVVKSMLVSYCVAVLCLQRSHFAVGTLHPLGMLAMKIRHLKALGYHVVLVPIHKFKTLEMAERILFLRTQVFSGKSTAVEEPTH